MIPNKIYLDYEGLKYYNSKLKLLIEQAKEVKIGESEPIDSNTKIFIDENEDYEPTYTAALIDLKLENAINQITELIDNTIGSYSKN